MYSLARSAIEASNLQNEDDPALARTLNRARRLRAYRDVGSARLQDFPLISKADVRKDPAAYEAKLVLPTSVQHTSGTTGAPLRVVRSLDAVVFEQALVDWLVEKAGISLRRSRVAVLRGADIKAPSEQDGPFWQLAGNTLTFSSNHLSKATIHAFLGALADFQPDVVLAYPSVLENLLKLADGAATRWTCPLALTSSEVLLPEARRRMAERLGGAVFDYYGQAERVACAWSIEPDDISSCRPMVTSN